MSFGIGISLALVSGHAAIWTPLELDTVLKGWWDFNDPETLNTDEGVTLVSADADPIQQVNDKSGNDKHMTQATLARRPLYRTSLINAHSTAEFSGAHALSLASAVDPAMDDFCLVVVCRANANTGTHIALNGGNGASNGIAIAHQTTGAKKGMFIFGTGYINSAVDPDTSLHTLVMRRTGGVASLYEDGGIAIVTSAGVPLQPTGATIGALSASASGSFNGNICEALYLVDPTASQINELGGYLADKWGATWTDLDQEEVAPLLEAGLAFPEATGYGRFSQGGRGGAVLHVTNLNNSGAGSLRAACNASGARTVVFDVSGTIELLEGIFIGTPYLTVAGQTAPGNGIQIRMATTHNDSGAPFVVRTHDVIVRYLRFRPGPGVQNMGIPDAFTITSEAGKHAYNIIVDHCSMEWAVDKTFELNGPWQDFATVPRSHSVTLQKCIVAEALHLSSHDKGAHSKGSITVHCEDVSFVHNIFAINHDRNPMIKSVGRFDFVNNLVYHNSANLTSATKIETEFMFDDDPQHINITHNLYIFGPLATEGLSEVTKVYRAGDPVPDMRYYIHYNVGPNIPLGGFDNTAGYKQLEWDGSVWQELPQVGLVNTPNPGPSYPLIEMVDLSATLQADVGAWRRLDENGNWVSNRDAVDARILGYIDVEGGGLINDPSEVGGWPDLSGGIPYLDSDGDGMPDAWETAQGLNPNDASDRNGDTGATGYTNLERFLNGGV